MKKKKLKIAFLTTMVYNMLSEEIWKGIVDVLGTKEVDLFCVCSRRMETQDPNEKANQESVVYDIVSPKEFDGLIIYGGAVGNMLSLEKIEQFCKKYYPLPVINLSLTIPGVHSINIANYKGLYDLVTHLIVKHGYRKIAFIKGPENHEEAMDRFRAYRDALRDHNISFDPAYTAPGNFEVKSGRDAVKLFLDIRKLKPDVIVSVDDEAAIGAVEAIKKRGLNIPGDIAITGFDDAIGARNVKPPLSTVKQPVYEMGRIAAENLLNVLEGKHVEKNIIVPTEMVIRQSCGCVGAVVKKIDFKTPGNAGNTRGAIDKILRITASILAHDESKGFDAETVRKFVEDFFLSIEKKMENLFLSTFRFSAFDDALLSLLHHYVLPYIEQSDFEFFSNMMQQARVLISKETENREKELLLSWNERNVVVVFADKYLNQSISLIAFFDRFVQLLPLVGIQGCYICFYKDPKNPVDLSKLMFAYHDKRKLEVKARDFIFDTIKILPESLLMVREKYQKFILPLNTHEEVIGYTVYEIEPEYINLINDINLLITTNIKRLFLETERREKADEMRRLNLDLKHEILERKQAVEAAEAANRTKSKFLANMSHEIRTPMNAILGFAEIVHDRVQNPDLQDLLSTIRSSGNMLLDIINDVLDLSAVEAGKLTIKKNPFDIYSVFVEMKALFSQKLANKNLEFQLDFDNNLPKVVILDKSRIRQILINLIGNAIKFTHDGHIKLSARYFPKTEERGSRFIFSVEDTGIGIAENQREKIFDVFEQQDGQSQEEYGGTGLGLSITRRLVELMNGTIRVSGEVNQGSLFTVTLNDVEVAHEEALAEDITDFDPNGILFEKGTILNVDDIETNRKIVREFLHSCPFNIIDAVNGEEAIALAEKHQPDLILMDMKMPVMDGYEASSRIKKSETLQSIPIISLSASVMKEELEKISEYCDDTLMKPMQRAELIQKIMKFLPWSESKPKSASKTEPALSEFNPKQAEAGSLSAEALKGLPEALDILENKMKEQWEVINTGLKFNKIKAFAEEVELLAEQYNLPALSNWAKTLLQQARTFKIKKLPETIQQYPKLIKQFRDQLSL